jgi:hypothetical protein
VCFSLLTLTLSLETHALCQDVIYEKMRANTDNIEHLLDSGAVDGPTTANLRELLFSR